MIMHVDGNSFYASCERIFRPDLEGKPVAVLSNNDGVTVALNGKCKELGFRRGDIFFQRRGEYERAGVTVFSSNYTLYADISARLNALYSEYAENLEVYSIDESFIFLPDFTNVGFTEIGEEIRRRAGKEIHVPVAVGIAATKTLAKMCNKMAKKMGGVCDWNGIDRKAALESFPVRDIWGIGSARASVLERMGITNAYELACMPLAWARRHLTIEGFRTVQELNGVAAVGFDSGGKKKTVTASRSFSKPVTELDGLEVALSEYTQQAVERMRGQGSACRAVQVYLMTGRAYSEQERDKEYFNGAARELHAASSYLPEIFTTARMLLRALYRSGYAYRKVMVCLLGLEDDRETQPELFDDGGEGRRVLRRSVMDAVDSLNERYGRGCVHLGTRNILRDVEKNGCAAKWKMERGRLSPEYTTSWEDVPAVK